MSSRRRSHLLSNPKLPITRAETADPQNPKVSRLKNTCPSKRRHVVLLPEVRQTTGPALGPFTRRVFCVHPKQQKVPGARGERRGRCAVFSSSARRRQPEAHLDLPLSRRENMREEAAALKRITAPVGASCRTEQGCRLRELAVFISPSTSWGGVVSPRCSEVRSLPARAEELVLLLHISLQPQ